MGTDAVEADSPARVYHQLRQNAEWRLLFGDRAHKHLFNGGVLTTNQTIPRFLGLCDQIDRAIIGESARWGDVVRKTQPYTRNVEWLTEKDRLLTKFFPTRTALVIQQFKNAGLYPMLQAPSFTPQGGTFTNVLSLAMFASAGTIYYTTNGADPRVSGGALAPDATMFTDPVTLTGTTRVLARTFYTNTWSALNEATFFGFNSSPKLDLVWNGTTVTLSWAPEIVGYQLESSTDLRSPVWSPIPTGPGNTVNSPRQQPQRVLSFEEALIGDRTSVGLECIDQVRSGRCGVAGQIGLTSTASAGGIIADPNQHLAFRSLPLSVVMPLAAALHREQ